MPVTKSPRSPVAVFPVPVIVDSREGLPYSFAGLRTDVCDGNRPLVVTLKGGTLRSGDYSLEGFENRVAVERKGGGVNGAADLFGTLGQNRGRFVRELERLADLDAALVVVEASWEDVLFRPPVHSALNPKTVHRSVLAWMVRYPSVHWVMAGGRRLGEITTLRWLERWWKEQGRKAKEVVSA